MSEGKSIGELFRLQMEELRKRMESAPVFKCPECKEEYSIEFRGICGPCKHRKEDAKRFARPERIDVVEEIFSEIEPDSRMKAAGEEEP